MSASSRSYDHPLPSYVPSPPDRSPPLPSILGFVRPSTLFLLIFTLTPFSLLHLLPFPALHNPLTLLCAILVLQSPPTLPARLLATLIFSLCLVTQYAITVFHTDAAIQRTLISRVLTVATLGTCLNLLATWAVFCLWWVVLVVGVALFTREYATCFLAAGGNLEQLQATGVMAFLKGIGEGDQTALCTFWSQIPAALVNALSAALLARGYAAMVVGLGGRVAPAVSVVDIVAFGAAGGVGLCTGKQILPRLWEAGKCREWTGAVLYAMDGTMWMVVNVSSHVFVSLALAERDLLGIRSCVLTAVLAVFIFRMTLLLLEVLDKRSTCNGMNGNWSTLFGLRIAVSGWFAKVCWERFVIALATESQKSATF